MTITQPNRNQQQKVYIFCQCGRCTKLGDVRVASCELFYRSDGCSKAKNYSEIHTPDLQSEVDRISGKGGLIINGRVNGQIAITRSLGDHLMKEYIISDPFCTSKIIEEGIDEYLIVACDGVSTF